MLRVLRMGLLPDCHCRLAILQLRFDHIADPLVLAPTRCALGVFARGIQRLPLPLLLLTSKVHGLPKIDRVPRHITPPLAAPRIRRTIQHVARS